MALSRSPAPTCLRIICSACVICSMCLPSCPALFLVPPPPQPPLLPPVLVVDDCPLPTLRRCRAFLPAVRCEKLSRSADDTPVAATTAAGMDGCRRPLTLAVLLPLLLFFFFVVVVVVARLCCCWTAAAAAAAAAARCLAARLAAGPLELLPCCFHWLFCCVTRRCIATPDCRGLRRWQARRPRSSHTQLARSAAI
jgi:hypothetical protein